MNKCNKLFLRQIILKNIFCDQTRSIIFAIHNVHILQLTWIYYSSCLRRRIVLQQQNMSFNRHFSVRENVSIEVETNFTTGISHSCYVSLKPGTVLTSKQLYVQYYFSIFRREKCLAKKKSIYANEIT